jgi:hypothetical protein
MSHNVHHEHSHVEKGALIHVKQLHNFIEPGRKNYFRAAVQRPSFGCVIAGPRQVFSLS